MADNNGKYNDSVWVASLRWLFGQEANTVLLFVIVGMIGYGTYYAIQTAIPKHLDSIQAGYERIDRAHGSREREFRETLRDQAQTYERTLERISTTFDRALDSRRHNTAENSGK